MSIKKSNNLGLNIFGGSGYTSIFSTTNMHMKSDLSSGNLNLSIKSNPTGVAINHKTNWDFSLRPPVNTNYIANGDLEFSLSDFSSNPNDDYYSYTNGKNGIDYYLSANWEINDIVGIDDITVLGISNWTSTEKIILDNENTRNAKIYSYAIGKYEISTGSILPVYFPVTSTEYTVYNYVVTVYRTDIYCDTSGGTLTINFDYGSGSSSVSQVIGSSGDHSYPLYISTTTSYDTPLDVADLDYTYDGVPDVIITDISQCITTFVADSPATETVLIQDPIPDGAVQVGDYYYFPSSTYFYTQYNTATKTLTKNSYDITFNLTSCPCEANPNILKVEWQENGATQSEVVCNPTNGQTISINEYINPDLVKDLKSTNPRVFIDGIEYDFNSCFTKGAVTTTSVSYRGAIYDTVRSREFNGINWNTIYWYSTPKYLKNVPTYSYGVEALPVGSFFGSTNKYVPPILGSSRRLNFILTNLSPIFKVQSPYDNEYLDYSDIFIEVTYKATPDECSYYNESKLYTDVTAEANVKTYKFAGSLSLNEVLLQNNSNDETNILTDDQSYWKIIVDDNKNTVGVLLSSYSTNWTMKRYAFNDPNIPTSINRTFIDGTLPPDYGVLDSKEVAIEDVKVFKVVNFPNCGKVDVYTKLTGDIESVSSSIITSAGHGLINGDRIKITGGLSSTTNDKTNINGVFSVIVIDNNRFKIEITSGSGALTIVNLGSLSGTQWTKVDDSGWRYQTSIYSPCGKNGYSTKDMQLLAYQEDSSNAGDDIYQRGYTYTASIDTFMNEGEDNYSLPEVKYPQGYLDGRRSWNNFYPFNRFTTTDAIAYGVINGNKFGYSMSIKKYSDTEYILAVSEPGATESFQIIDFFENSTTNQKVIPSYLPYGRIHFYKLTKTRKKSDLQIEYLNSLSKNNHPWSSYESSNKNLKSLAVDKTDNYPILSSTIALNYNTSTNDYWNGARFVSWSKEYVYSPLNDIYRVDYDAYPYEFSYLDFFGKSTDFSISGNTLYCISSTNVKNANFLNNNRVGYVDTTVNYFTYDIDTNIFSSINQINNSGIVKITDPTRQYQEYSKFGTKVVANEDRCFWGWPGQYKELDYLYYYRRSGDSYVLKQTLTSSLNSSFGAYIVAKDDFLITNKTSYTDDSGSLTVNPIDYIQVYRHYSSDDVYVYDSRISPTFDLSNPIYSGINSNFYETTSNISYDKTISNSASYITPLQGRYDLYNNILILRDPYEISYLHYNFEDNKFEPKGHQFIGPNDAKNTVIKVFPSYAAAFLDTATDYDLGEFSSSLQIVNGSQFITTSELLYGISTDIQKPEYLSLFLKNIEGYGSGSTNLHMQANHSSGDLELFYKVFDGHSLGVELYIHPPIVSSGNIELVVGGQNIESGVRNLFLANNDKSGNLNLYLEMGNTTSGFLPLLLYNPINVSGSSNALNFNLEATYTGVPNSSGMMPISIVTIPYDDHATYMPLLFTGNKTTSSGINLNTYSAGGSSSGEISSVDLFINSERISHSGFMPLFIDKPITENLQLVVYNKVVETGLSMYASGAATALNASELFIFGKHVPNASNRLFIKGIYIE